MLIKHVNKKVFDLFFNSGWENWARFEIIKTDQHKRQLKQIAGEHTVPPGIRQYLDKKYGV